jgi:hypothetical protein
VRWLLLLLFAPMASAGSISLCNLCNNYTISKRADGAVVIRCPGKAEPLFVMQNCKNPSMSRLGPNATLTCR